MIVEYWATYDSPGGERQKNEQLLTTLVNKGWEIKTAGGGAGRTVVILVREQ
jgi:hypothetical protein